MILGEFLVLMQYNLLSSGQEDSYITFPVELIC